MSDTVIWADAFAHDFSVAHERTLRGLSKVPERVYYPGARRDGGRDGAWLRITASTGRVWTGVFASELVEGRLSVIASWPQPSTLLVAVGGGPYLVDTRDAVWLGRLDDEVHLRGGDLLHRVSLRHGRTVTERASW